MSIFEDFENKKKINMQDDPVELLKKVRVRDGNLITRRSGRHTQEILARYHQSIVQYQEYMRSHDDNREQRVMLYAEIKALAIGNPLIKKRVETANMIEHTRISSRQRIKELSDLKEIIDHQPERMIRQKELIRVTQADAEYYQQNRSRISQEERKAFGEELILALLSNAEKNEAKIFDEYQGFKVELPRLMEHDKPFVNLIGPNGGRYYTAMDYDKPMGCSQRLDILLDRLGQRAQEQTERLSQMRRQLKDARADFARGNPYPDRVEELERELAEIDQKLEESEAA